MLIPQNNKSEHNFWGTYYRRQNKGGGLLYSCNGRKNVITGQKRDKTREGLIIKFHTMHLHLTRGQAALR